MRWMDDAFSIMQADMHPDVDVLPGLATSIGKLTISTAFSGIGAPEHSLLAVGAALQHHLKLDAAPSAQCLSCMEWAQEGRLELACLPHPPECRFTDVNFCWHPSVRRSLVAASQSPDPPQRADFKRIIDTGAAASTHAWCERHQGSCPFKTAMIHVAGPPCTDWSPQGARKRRAGPTNLCTMGWVCQRCFLQEDIIVHEEVKEYPIEDLIFFLDKYYVMQSVLTNPLEIGNPVARVRRITVFLHKKRVHSLVTG